MIKLSIDFINNNKLSISSSEKEQHNCIKSVIYFLCLLFMPLFLMAFYDSRDKPLFPTPIKEIELFSPNMKNFEIVEESSANKDLFILKDEICLLEDNQLQNVLSVNWHQVWDYEADSIPISVSVSADGSYIAVGGSEKIFFFNRNGNLLWDYQTDIPIVGITMNADANEIVGGGEKVYFLNRQGELMNSYTQLVSSVSLSPDGNYFAQTYDQSMGPYDRVALWGYDEGRWLWYQAIGRKGSGSVSISSYGEYVAVGAAKDIIFGYSGEVRLYNKNGDLFWKYEIDKKSLGGKYSVSISSDGRYLAAGNRANDMLYFFNRDKGYLWSYETGAVNGVSVSGDGSYIVAATKNLLYYFDLQMNLLWTKEIDNLEDVALTSDATMIVAITKDNRVYAFNKDDYVADEISVFGIEPSEGLAGDVVTITGMGFSKLTLDDVRVRYEASPHLIAVGEILSLEPSQIVVKVPPLDLRRWVNKSVDVYLLYRYGVIWWKSSNKLQFTYNEPNLISIDPSRTMPGRRVTLSGAYFGDGESGGPYFVKFGTERLYATSEKVSWSNNQIVIAGAPTSLGLGGTREARAVKALLTLQNLAKKGFWQIVKTIALWLVDSAIPSHLRQPVPVSDDHEDWLVWIRSFIAPLLPGFDITLVGDLTVPVTVTTPVGESETFDFTFTREWVPINGELYWTLPSPNIILYGESPAEFRVYDSQGNYTGLSQGELKEDIPNSLSTWKTVFVFDASDSYVYNVIGTDGGTYGIMVAYLNEAEVDNFYRIDAPISTNEVHQYTIDWDALARGERGVTIQIDSMGDGIFEETITTTQPYKPSDLWPYDKTNNVTLETELTWQGGDPDTTKELIYSIYLGTNDELPLLDTIGPVSAAQDKITYKPIRLEPYTTYYWKIDVRDNYGITVQSPVWSFTTGEIVSVEENEHVPIDYNLYQNYPNPFNPVTNIGYELPQNNQVVLTVHNTLGHRVATLVAEYQPVGRYKVTFDSKDLPSGVYFYRIKAGEFVDTKKMLILK